MLFDKDDVTILHFSSHLSSLRATVAVENVIFLFHQEQGVESNQVRSMPRKINHGTSTDLYLGEMVLHLSWFMG